MSAQVEEYERTGNLKAAITKDCGPSWRPFTAQEYDDFWTIIIDDLVRGRSWDQLAHIRADCVSKLSVQAEHRFLHLHGALTSILLFGADKLFYSSRRSVDEVPDVAAAVKEAVPGMGYLALLGNVYMCRGEAAFKGMLAEVQAMKHGLPCLSFKWTAAEEARRLGLRDDPSPGMLLTGVFLGSKLKFAAVKMRHITSLKVEPRKKVDRALWFIPAMLQCLDWMIDTPPLADNAGWPQDDVYEENPGACACQSSLLCCHGWFVTVTGCVVLCCVRARSSLQPSL